MSFQTKAECDDDIILKSSKVKDGTENKINNFLFSGYGQIIQSKEKRKKKT